MRTLALFLIMALLLGAASCSKEHGELLDSFAAIPELTEARLGGANADSVYLSWTYPHAADVDEYRIYVGIYINFGYAEFDELIFTGLATTDTSFVYYDEYLPYEDEELCEQFGLCDSIYKYTYFRISAMVGGEEGKLGWRFFPGW